MRAPEGGETGLGEVWTVYGILVRPLSCLYWAVVGGWMVWPGREGEGVGWVYGELVGWSCELVRRGRLPLVGVVSCFLLMLLILLCCCCLWMEVHL